MRWVDALIYQCLDKEIKDAMFCYLSCLLVAFQKVIEYLLHRFLPPSSKSYLEIGKDFFL